MALETLVAIDEDLSDMINNLKSWISQSDREYFINAAYSAMLYSLIDNNAHPIADACERIMDDIELEDVGDYTAVFSEFINAQDEFYQFYKSNSRLSRSLCEVAEEWGDFEQFFPEDLFLVQISKRGTFVRVTLNREHLARQEYLCRG